MLEELSPIAHSSYFEKVPLHWIFFFTNFTLPILSLLILWNYTKINYLYLLFVLGSAFMMNLN